MEEVMRIFSFAFLGLSIAFGGLYATNEPEANPSATEIRDYDQQIALLKQEIAKYNSLATQFDRKATQLRSRDYSGYRSAAELRDRCRSIAADLQKHLEGLEKQENALIVEQKKGETK
jgi:hypothetical protein